MSLHELLTASYAYIPPAAALEDLTDADATRRPDGVPHSIAAIVAHMAFWQEWFLRRIDGTAEPIPQHAATGWPPVAAGQWAAVRETFLDGLARAVVLADRQPEPSPRLDPAIAFEPLAAYTVRDALLHAAVHNAHHLGQVITLRQLLGRWPPAGGGLTW